MLLSYYLKRSAFCLTVIAVLAIPVIALTTVSSRHDKTSDVDAGDQPASDNSPEHSGQAIAPASTEQRAERLSDPGSIRLAAYGEVDAPQKLTVDAQGRVYPTTGAGNPFSSKRSEELPSPEQTVPSSFPSTDQINGFESDNKTRSVLKNKADELTEDVSKTKSTRKPKPAERLKSKFEFVAPKPPRVASALQVKTTVATDKMADSDEREDEADSASTDNEHSVATKQETPTIAPATSPTTSSDFNGEPLRVARSQESTNAIRNAITPENYSYSEQKSDPNSLENAWNTHKTPDQITNKLWWNERARQPLRDQTIALPIDLDSLLVRALQHSAQIRVFSELPLIRDTAITEASATFDWSAFMEAMWNDTSDPVGNTLTTNASRFNDQHATASAGLRKRNQLGGEFEVAQEAGHQNNNSNFFIPNDQGTARLRMSYSHPLLRGGGKYYNQSLIVLARVDSKVARDELERQVEGHLLEVTRAYWGLALERAAYLQRVRLFERSSEIRDNLVGRQGLDSYRSQIVRADSAVSSREAALIRAEVAVRNAEARVRALVNDPAFGDEQSIEIIPIDSPVDFEVNSDLEEVLLVAMQNRSEVLQAFKQIKAAGVRKDMTKNELLPTLNMVMNSYLSGLRGNSDVPQAWTDQFTRGAPSYGVGFQYDMPVRNRAAKARHQRRRLELRQFESQLRLTMETVNLEVGVAVRESDAAFREMRAKYRAMVAASEDAEFVKQRWELLPGDHQNASLVFDDLLRTQQRLTDAENEFAKAQITYNLSLTNIKKAAGILLETERISTSELQDACGPQILFDKYIEPANQDFTPVNSSPINVTPTDISPPIPIVQTPNARSPNVEIKRQASLGENTNMNSNQYPVPTLGKIERR